MPKTPKAKPAKKPVKKTQKRTSTKKAAKSIAPKKKTKNTKPKPAKKPVKKTASKNKKVAREEPLTNEQNGQDSPKNFDDAIKEIFARLKIREVIVKKVNSKKAWCDEKYRTLGDIRDEIRKKDKKLSNYNDIWRKVEDREEAGLPPYGGNKEKNDARKQNFSDKIEDLIKRLEYLESVRDSQLPEYVKCEGKARLLREVEREVKELREDAKWCQPPPVYADDIEPRPDADTVEGGKGRGKRQKGKETETAKLEKPAGKKNDGQKKRGRPRGQGYRPVWNSSISKIAETMYNEGKWYDEIAEKVTEKRRKKNPKVKPTTQDAVKKQVNREGWRRKT